MLIALALLPTLAFASSHPHTRQGWCVGVGMGAGSSALTGGGFSTTRETGAAGSLRVGYAFNPKVSLGLESNIWFKSESGVDFTLGTYAAAATIYPSEGLILRAGVGGTDATAQVSQGSTTYTATESGWGGTAGIAYEFRITRRMALGPQFDYSYVNLDSFNANYFNFGASLNWYFIPR